MNEGARLGRWEGEIKPERIREDRFWNAEVGMRPPAHRGLRLRPGGKWERRSGLMRSGRCQELEDRKQMSDDG